MDPVPLKDLERYIESFENVTKAYSLEPDLAVYSVNEQMFALVYETRQPLLLSVRCDEQLAVILRDKYETIMPGKNLHPKKWNTIVLSGQIPFIEIQDFIRHSYLLALSLGTI